MARSSRLTGWASQDRVEHGPGHAGDEAGPAAGLGPLEDGVDAAGQDTGGPDQAPVPSQERALWARATAIVIVVAVSAGLAAASGGLFSNGVIALCELPGSSP